MKEMNKKGFTIVELVIVIAVIVLVVGSAAAYVIRAKRNGKKCIGCSESGSCPAKNNGENSCIGTCGSCSAECHGKSNK